MCLSSGTTTLSSPPENTLIFFFFHNSRTLCVWDVFKRWALSLCVFCSSKSPKGYRGNVKAWEGAWGGRNMKIFEDWCTELTLLSIAAQMTTSLSAPPLEILSKVPISGVVWMKFLQELYFWSWAYSYAELETPTNSSHLATKWPRREETGMWWASSWARLLRWLASFLCLGLSFDVVAHQPNND